VSVSIPDRHMMRRLTHACYCKWSILGKEWGRGKYSLGSLYVPSYIMYRVDLRNRSKSQVSHTVQTCLVRPCVHHRLNHYLRNLDFTTPPKLSDPSIVTAIEIPGDIPIFSTGACCIDETTAYVISGQVNDEAWVSRQGEFLSSQLYEYLGRRGSIHV
jgi:hypothetical protein